MRVKDLGNTATDFASDDYIVIDGSTNGSRKMKNDALLNVSALNSLKVTKNAIFSEVFNGGVGNALNAWKVRTSGIPIPNRGTIQFYTTRPLPEGHYYRVGYILTDDEAAVGKELHNNTSYNVLILRTEDQEKIKLGEAINLSAYPKAKVLAFEIAEYDETNTHVTLRKEDFANYEIGVEPFSQNFVNKAATNKCIAYWDSHVGGSVSFSFRCQVGVKIFVGFVIAQMTWGNSTNGFRYIVSDDSVTLPFRLRTDGTRSVVDMTGTTFCEINVLNCSENVRVGYGYAYPNGWDELSAYSLNPVFENLKNIKLPSVPNSGVIAYLTGAAGGLVSFSYRYQSSKGMVTGIARATFTNTSTPSYKRIDYLQFPIGAAFPFTLKNDGTRTIIENTSGGSVEVANISCSGAWIYSDVSYSAPSSWDSGSATDIGQYIDLMDKTADFTASKIYTSILDGGVNNIGNAWKVRTTGIKFANKTAFQLSINRPLAAGHYYRIGWILSNDETDAGKSVSLGGAHVITSRTEDIAKIKLGDVFDVTSYTEAKVIAFEIAEYDETDTHTTLRKEDFEGDFISIIAVPNDDEIVVVDETLDYSAINAIARINYASNGSKDFCALIVTDSHNDDTSVSRAVAYTGKASAASALIHGGDYAGSYIGYGQTSTNWASAVSGSSKPAFFVQGNHEKGTFYNIKTTPSDTTLYNLFVKPIVDKGYLSVGEYEVNKCYYYHDFSTLKTRLIVLDEYRAPNDYNETYWQAITYDSTLSDIADNTDYSIGDKVNVPNFTANSFQAVQAVNTGAYYSGKQPCYRCRRGYRYIDQTEANWFLDTLYSTPSDYVVVVAMHNPFSDLATPDKTKKFCQQVNIGDSITGADWAQNYMNTDFVADALNAFVLGNSYTATISTKTDTEASYISDYSVTKDFSLRGTGKLGLIIGGHVHRDVVWKHPTYTYMYQVTPMCSITTSRDNNYTADIRLQNDVSFDKYIDSLTAFAVADGRAALAKLGCKFTTDALVRDIEVL